MDCVLVTGATGFIGVGCLPRLRARGYRVHAVSSRARVPVLAPSARESDAAVTWHQVDLMDPAQTARLLETVQPTHLLHLAWYVLPGQLATAPENFQWVQASLELLRRFGEGGGRRVVMAGSAHECDWGHGDCAGGGTPPLPAHHYRARQLGLAPPLRAYD